MTGRRSALRWRRPFPTARFIHEHNLPTCVILLTGHKNFEYARSAIEYRVKRYLLKPITVPQLKAVFRETCAALDDQEYIERVMQSILYLPHFISWVVVISMLTGLLSQSTGVVNMVRKAMGMETIPFMNSKRWFRTVLIGAGLWKECGWGTVVYMAALSGIDPALYEAATIDGVNRIQKITHITLPCIMGTVTVMLVMNMGNILSNGFEQIWLLQNALNKEVAEVLETYSYQVGLKEGCYSFATAVGMFQSLVGLIMIFGSNALSKRMGGGGLW